METEYDVLIVGYGVLGNVAALLLANLGMSVAVVEKKELDDLLLAKSARIDDEVMLIFEQLGLMDELKEVLYPLKGTQIVDKQDRVLLELNQNRHSQFAPVMGFYQPDLQHILQQATQKHSGIRVYSGCEVETFEEVDDDKIDVYIATTGKQNFTVLQTSFMLVCNGQYSRIADFLDIDINDFNYHSSVLCVDTINRQKTANSQSYAQTIYDAEFPVTRITKDQQRQRWEFQIEAETIQAKQTPEKVRNLLAELSTLDLEVVSAFVYNFDSKILENWRYNRVLIAGDAAHIMPPYLGMGLSAGIKDVYNLTWKINLIRQGTLALKVLDTYQKERLPDVQHLIKLNLWIKRLFQSSKLRWIKGFIPVIPKWFLKRKLDSSSHIKSGIIATKTKGAGRVIVSPKVATQKGEVISFNKALGTQFVLLAISSNPVDALRPNQLEYLALLGTQFIQLTTAKKKFVQDNRYAQNLYDKEGKIQKWMKEHKAKFVLIRPDRIVYDFCSNPETLNNSIKKLKKTLRISTNV
ncbi:FAD-dependent monooxygenase [Aureispira anguillae]|uniref:FAD-dependent monooxygenase n=1 Tax=Aureispira anguillae TaxID=2864201 RepID=A0A915YE42_9BACT|nr:FAD-dependent monooxygenase [Aureispira anguillae]BDS11343.1 FAD-dependent monooxygenase [Aureispira anguillae]